MTEEVRGGGGRVGGQDDGFSRETGEEKQPVDFTNTFCCLLVWYQL